MMYKWFFLACFVCVTANDEKIYSFNQGEEKLAKCIEKELVNFDGTFESSEVANEMAYLASRRLHGKSTPSNGFNKIMAQFYYELRNNIIKSSIKKDQISKLLQKALKHALNVCASITIKKKKVIVQDKKEISFSQNKLYLFGCIEGYLRLTGHREFIQQNRLTKFIADFAAERYQSRSFSKEDFHQTLYRFYYVIRQKKEFSDIITDELFRELLPAIKQTVEDCSEGKLPLTAVPTFENESPGIAHILDLILVKWPNNLYHMIQSWKGRAILRRCANDALTALVSELNVFQNNTQLLRLTLQSFWIIRAQEMYDGNSAEPYIVHRYTSKYPTPHMVQSDFDKFRNRNSTNFNKRNLRVSESHLHEILNIHRSDRLNINGDVGIYNDYLSTGMTNSEYYFENQKTQFYRIIFFVLELQARKICTVVNDVFDGPFSYDLVPEYVQAIVYDDNVYQDYLLKQRLFFEMLMSNGHTSNDIAQNLFRNPWVMEENLILLMSNTPSTSGIQSRSESTTVVSTISTTTQSHKRKDNVWKNSKGKCFSKRTKMTTVSDVYSADGILGTEEVTRSTVKESPNNSMADFTDEEFSICFFDEFGASLKQEKNETDSFHGYVISNDDFKQFSQEELLAIQDMSCFSEI